MSENNNLAHKIADVLRAASGKSEKKYFTSAVILAAGSSTRMGGESKQFIVLNGIPVVAHTVLAFDGSDHIDEIVLVCKKDEMNLYDGFVTEYNLQKPFYVVEGGATRQESARKGCDAVSSKSKYIAIHDAARCLITANMIKDVCQGAYRCDGAILAVKAVDTVKIGTKNGYIESTPERKYTWQAQTPQVFKTNAFRAATYVARDEDVEGTDDASLLEHIGIPVRLIEGSRENIKVTEPLDIKIAKAILDSRAENANTKSREAEK